MKHVEIMFERRLNAHGDFHIISVVGKMKINAIKYPTQVYKIAEY